MGPIGYVLLIVVAASIVALIYVSRKRKALDEDSYIKTPSGSSVGAEKSPVITAPKEEDKTSGSTQTTIYEFRATAGTRLCPFCDGENSTGSKTCIICGHNLS